MDTIKPIFPCVPYCVENVTTKNTFTLSFDEFSSLTDRNTFTICKNCRVQEDDNNRCTECVIFSDFNESFLLANYMSAWWIPPPKIFAKKNLSYFFSLVEIFKKTFHTYELPSTNCDERSIQKLKQILIAKYQKFTKECSFKGGFVQKQIAGKYSFTRTYILGALVNGVRGTLTVDPCLLPHEIGLPKSVYNKLNSIIPYVIINRDPSINSRSVYVCKIIPVEDESDFTIHLNQYILNGLHADQDGDEINVYYIINNGDESFEMSEAIHEIILKSWDKGYRYDCFGKCRYSFSQYHLLVLHRYNKELCELSPFWKGLQSYDNRADLAFQLGSFTHRTEFDEFLICLTNFCKKILYMVNYDELLNGCGILNEVIESGAKGTKAHMELYLDGFIQSKEDSFITKAITNFNKYVSSNGQMKIAGRKQFCLLHVYQNVYLQNENIYVSDKILFSKVFNCPLYSILLYNSIVVEYNLFNN